MKTRRDKLDIAFSSLVRERADWKCEHCQKDCRENPGSLHCSHFFSRRKASTRWDPDNAAAHCFSCHQKLGENPIDFNEWIRGHLGMVRYSNLQTRQATILKLTKPEREDVYQRMKASLVYLALQREDGAAGYLPFPSPYDDDTFDWSEE